LGLQIQASRVFKQTQGSNRKEAIVIKQAKISNEELVRRYQAGDQDAISILLDQNSGAAHKVTRKLFSLNSPSYCDAVQECLIAMIRSAESYDASHGVQFITYAWRAMANQAFRVWQSDTVVRFATTPGAERKGITSGDDAWDHFRTLEDDTDSPPETTMRRIDADRLWSVIREIDGKSRVVIKRRLRGDTLKEIGDDIGCCRERVRQLEMNARHLIWMKWKGITDDMITVRVVKQPAKARKPGSTTGRPKSRCCGSSLHKRTPRADGTINFRCYGCGKAHSIKNGVAEFM